MCMSTVLLFGQFLVYFSLLFSFHPILTINSNLLDTIHWPHRTSIAFLRPFVFSLLSLYITSRSLTYGHSSSTLFCSNDYHHTGLDEWVKRNEQMFNVPGQRRKYAAASQERVTSSLRALPATRSTTLPTQSPNFQFHSLC